MARNRKQEAHVLSQRGIQEGWFTGEGPTQAIRQVTLILAQQVERAFKFVAMKEQIPARSAPSSRPPPSLRASAGAAPLECRDVRVVCLVFKRRNQVNSADVPGYH